MLPFGGIGALFGGYKPTKVPCGDATGPGGPLVVHPDFLVVHREFLKSLIQRSLTYVQCSFD